MERMDSLYSMVKAMLEAKPDCRNSDDVLYMNIIQTIGFMKGCDALEMPVGHFFKLRKCYEIPSYESCRRARQKVQEKHPELRACKAVADARAEKADAMREWARGKKSDDFNLFDDI